jgi:hypothetical protein
MADDQHGAHPAFGPPDLDGHMDGQPVDAVSALRLNAHSNLLP